MPFPTAGVLDNATRADEGPPPSANWTTTPFNYSPAGHEIISNRLAPDSAGTFGGDYASSYWSASTFAEDQEVRIGSDVQSGAVVLFLRYQQIAAGTVDGYEVEFDVAADVIQVRRVDNEVGTQLGANISQTCNAGDEFGADMAGSTITAWRAASGGGAWTSIDTRSDATYSGSSSIGFFNDSVNDRFTYFAGGAYAGADAPETLRVITSPLRW